MCPFSSSNAFCLYSFPNAWTETRICIDVDTSISIDLLTLECMNFQPCFFHDGCRFIALCISTILMLGACINSFYMHAAQALVCTGVLCCLGENIDIGTYLFYSRLVNDCGCTVLFVLDLDLLADIHNGVFDSFCFSAWHAEPINAHGSWKFTVHWPEAC